MPPSNPVLDSLPADVSEKLTTISESAAKTGDQEMPEYETSEGSKVPGLETSEHPPPEIDDNLVKLLDRLLLYLRIVHSLDYYSGAEYLYEDDMPNRCGIIHIRSPLPDKVNYEEGMSRLGAEDRKKGGGGEVLPKQKPFSERYYL